MASIREVAKKAGVAACTVSRVLNGTANVASETKQKIEEAMKELNYIPNELARGMFRQKAGIVAMLVPNIKHPFFSSLADFIEGQLYKEGYKLMLCSTAGNIKREKEYLNFLKLNIVDGVIMAVNSLDDKEYLNFQKPIVMLDYFVNENIPLVVSNHKMGGKLAAEEFIRNNCKYVIHLCNIGENNKIISYESHIELEKILKNHGIKSRKVEIKWNSFDFSGYQELAKFMLESYPNIDGIMAADMPASAFLNAALKLNKKIPEELCIIAYDGTYAVHINYMELTTIVQPVEKISIEVVKLMVQMINKELPKKINLQIPVMLNKGQTT